MRNLILVLAGALAVAALLATSVGARPSARADSDPQIVLGSTEIGLRFGEGPTTNWDQPPAGIYLAYGLYQDGSFAADASLFDDMLIPPSVLPREWTVSVADSHQAAALAEALRVGAPPGAVFAVGQRLDGGGRGAGWGPGTDLDLASGATITQFKLLVPPFAIEEVPQVSPGSPPYSVYAVVPLTDPGLAVVEAYGPPPPGDANCDAVINSIDALVVLQLAARLIDELPCAKAADANGDGTVDSIDASLILQFAAGLISVP